MINGKYGEVDYLYNGQYGVTSDANGLYYMRARYYNIDIKRFINQDILTGSIDSSKSLNRYAYVEGNPISYLDPFGLEPNVPDQIHNIVVALQFAAQSFGFATVNIIYDIAYIVNSNYTYERIYAIGRLLNDLKDFGLGMLVSKYSGRGYDKIISKESMKVVGDFFNYAYTLLTSWLWEES